MSSLPPLSGKPARVRISVWILVLTTLLSLVRDGIAWQEIGPRLTFDHPNGFYVLLAIVAATCLGIFTLFLFGLFKLIGQGHNWARLLYLVVFLANAAVYLVVFFAQSYSKVPVLVSLSWVQFLLQGFALVLLFGGKAGRWFRPPFTPPPLSA